MPVRRVQRFTEADVQRVMARGNGSQKAAEPNPARNSTQSLDAGNETRLPCQAAGSAAATTSGGNATAMGSKAVKPSKYRNKKTTLDGITFDSKAEATQYMNLKGQEKAGLIRDLALQPVYVLAPGVVIDGRKRPALRYKADFSYQRNGVPIVEDVKGVITEGFRIKRHLMMAVHGIEVLLT